MSPSKIGDEWMDSTKEFQILSLDGGGIKGLFSAAFLAKLEEDLNIKIIDHFDLIVGTSTGGIIALGLGLGLSPRDLVEFYFNKGSKIFSKIPICTDIKNVLFSKYSALPLEKIFQEDRCFGGKLLGQSKKRLVIPAYDIDSNDVTLFKTAHHERFQRDYKIAAWKIARSTSAAPTFFPISKRVDNIRLVDGGVWANNPAMVGLVEAMSVLDVPLNKIKILSVGTTEELKQNPNVLDVFGGWFPWSKTAVELIMQAQSVSISKQVSLLLKDSFVRVNPVVSAGLFKLDKMNLNELSAYASKHSRDFSPTFVSKFKAHVADEFIPIYQL